jgi:hypothetical protein
VQSRRWEIGPSAIPEVWRAERNPGVRVASAVPEVAGARARCRSFPQMNLSPEHVIALAEAAGLTVSEEAVEDLALAVNALLELAATLDALPLEGVEPALGPQRWE